MTCKEAIDILGDFLEASFTAELAEELEVHATAPPAARI